MKTGHAYTSQIRSGRKSRSIGAAIGRDSATQDRDQHRYQHTLQYWFCRRHFEALLSTSHLFKRLWYLALPSGNLSPTKSVDLHHLEPVATVVVMDDPTSFDG
jgi:hypothetical protein